MLLSFGVTVLLGHAKVDDMDQVGVFRMRFSNQKVVGLDISVDQILFVDRLDATQLRSMRIAVVNEQARKRG